LLTSQYQGLTSFHDVGTFVPLSTDAQGQLIREVASAHITLLRPDHLGEQLCLQVALIRDLRRLVPVVPDQEDTNLPQRWDADRERTGPRWWEESWQATASPTKEMTAKLIPIVTTAPTIDAVENSEVAKRRTHLQQRLSRLKQWAQSAGKREAQASRRRERLQKAYKSRSKEFYRELGLYQSTLEEQGVPDYLLRRQVKERKEVVGS
jgi:hypothetical protein